MKHNNIILSGERESFKCNGKWTRSRKDWVKDQEPNDEITPVKIVTDGVILEGLKNKRTGAYFWESMRKPKFGEKIEHATRDFLTRKKNPLYVPVDF